MLKSVKYITLNGRIPSSAADAVAVMNTCEKLAENGFDVNLVVPSGMGLPADEYEDVWKFYDVKKNFKVNKIKTYFKKKLSTIEFLIKIFFLALKEKEDIFHVRHVELAVIAGIIGRKTIFESHNFAKAKKRKLIFKLFLFLIKRRSSLALISTTKAGAKAYELHGVPKEKIKVIPNGVNLDKFRSNEPSANLEEQLSIPKNKYIVCYAGSLYKNRGVEEILYVAKKLQDIIFLFVGGPKKRVDYYRKFAADKEIDNILFTGFVHQKVLPKYILSSDLLVMPYTSKTKTRKFMSPMKMFDYLASGKPIIASDFPVIREILTNKKNAILAEPDSGEAILEGVQILRSKPQLADRIAKNALNDAKEYTWSVRGRKISKWYAENFEKQYAK